MSASAEGSAVNVIAADAAKACQLEAALHIDLSRSKG